MKFGLAFIRGEGLIPSPLGRETNCSPLSMLGIKPETNTSGERNTPLLAAGYFIVYLLKLFLLFYLYINLYANPYALQNNLVL